LSPTTHGKAKSRLVSIPNQSREHCAECNDIGLVGDKPTRAGKSGGLKFMPSNERHNGIIPVSINYKNNLFLIIEIHESQLYQPEETRLTMN